MNAKSDVKLSEVLRGAKIPEITARTIVHDMRDLEPGEMLPPEATMLETYGVSRGSLREALRILEVQGLIILRPGPRGGPMVAAADSRYFARMSTLYFHRLGATYREVAESRLVMEPVMARLAALRRDPDSIASLLAFLEHAVEVSDPVQDFATSSAFHTLIAGMSGNHVLDLIGRSLKDVFVDRVEAGGLPLKVRQRVHKEHTRIAQAIIDGDATTAEGLMRAHMEGFVEYNVERDPGVLDEIVAWR